MKYHVLIKIPIEFRLSVAVEAESSAEAFTIINRCFSAEKHVVQRPWFITDVEAVDEPLGSEKVEDRDKHGKA